MDDKVTKEGPVVVRNHDIPLLAEVLPVMQLIGQTETLRDWQRARVLHITANLTGMPRGGGAAGLDDAVAAMDELDREQHLAVREYAMHLRRAQRILNGIESRTMRSFVMMKYVMGLPDAEVQRELNMTRRGFDRARRSVEDAQDMASVKWQERFILSREK